MPSRSRSMCASAVCVLAGSELEERRVRRAVVDAHVGERRSDGGMQRGAIGLRTPGGRMEPLGMVGGGARRGKGEAVDRPRLAAVAGPRASAGGASR